VQESSFEAGGLALNLATGPAAGAPVVLLHGVTRRWQDFLPILPALAARWHVHAIDLRGHGRSGRAAGAYRVIDYVPDVVAFLRDGLAGPAIVLGHSLGAMVAAAAAAEAPGRVRALVLEDPTFAMTGHRIGETGFLDLFRAYQAFAGSGRPVEEIAAALAEAPVAVPGRDGPVRLGEIRDPAALRLSASCLRRLDPDVLPPAIAGRWLDGYDVGATLGRVACPTLLLRGDFAAGGALPDAYAAELAAALRGCLHLRLSGVGHNIHATQAEAMLRLVLPFLASLE
jgi:pimeloyl-ACP methyl ester carboxylesterase